VGIKTDEVGVVTIVVGAVVTAVVAIDLETEGVVLEGVLLALPGPLEQKGQDITGARRSWEKPICTVHRTILTDKNVTVT
jgi:hypothetical protein